MHNTEFIALTERFFNHQAETLNNRAKVYASEEDRLVNFKTQARIAACHPLAALQGNALKHLASVLDVIRDAQYGVMYTEEYIDEKLGDLCNYLGPLLKGMLIDCGAIGKEIPPNADKH